MAASMLEIARRIRIPLAAIRHQRIGGVESAAYNLCRALHDTGAMLRVTLTQPDRLSPEFLNWLTVAGSSVETSRQIALPSRILSTRFGEELIHAAMERPDEHVIYPNYFLPPVPTRALSRSVIIHDCQHRTYPGFYTSKRRMWLNLCYAQALLIGDIVFTISEFERQKIIRFFGERYSSKIRVIGNAINIGRFATVPGEVERQPSWPFILMVAHHFPHKNVSTLVRAFALLAQKNMELRLVLVGSTSESTLQLVEELEGHIRERVMVRGFVSDRELGSLYRRTSLFVLPSLYEGFGMPAVEAMALAVPTLVSDGGALPEVTLGLAPTVPASADAATWADAIVNQLSSPKDPVELRRIAELVADAHSPAAVAKRVLGVLV